MLQTLPTVFSFRNRLRTNERTTTPTVPYRTRRERNILHHYLPTGDHGRALNLAQASDPVSQLATDCYNPLPKGSPRTPFPHNTFSTVICFRLATHLNPEDLEDLLWEASRICAPGGRLLLTVPSTAAPGKYAYTHAEVGDLHGTRWREVAQIGLSLYPVDRLPGWLRGPAGQLDTLLCQTPLKRLAAYRTYVLEKC